MCSIHVEMNELMKEARAGMSVELQTMTMWTSASDFDRLTGIRPTIPQEEL